MVSAEIYMYSMTSVRIMLFYINDITKPMACFQDEPWCWYLMGGPSLFNITRNVEIYMSMMVHITCTKQCVIIQWRNRSASIRTTCVGLSLVTGPGALYSDCSYMSFELKVSRIEFSQNCDKFMDSVGTLHILMVASLMLKVPTWRQFEQKIFQRISLFTWQ